MILLLPSQSTVLHAYAVLLGMTPGNAAFKDHQAYIASQTNAGYLSAVESYFAGTSTASLASTALTNLGLTSVFTQAEAEAFLTSNPGNRTGALIAAAAWLYSYSGADAGTLAAKAAYVSAIESSYSYSNNTANVDGKAWVGASGQSVDLTTGFDNLVGSALNDTFIARTLNNVNTLQDGDKVDGGTGVDAVYADFNAVTNGAAHTPNFSNIETVVVRAQTTSTDGTNSNNLGNLLVQIDAQRTVKTDVANNVTGDTGVTRWEDSNSRADLVIEDVRIGNAQKTKDITVAMVETDPGNVDFGLYFDQLSLRNSSSSSSSLTINIMDTGAAATAATAATPLLNNPYDTFKLGVNGVLTTIALDKTAVAAADTYAALLAVFNTALTGTGVVAALSGTFTITDPISSTSVTGQSIVLSSTGNTAITTPAGSGWFNTTGASVPATSNIYTTYTSGATSVSELVTSTVVLDDVGRGSTGGDLVIGGLSTGATSTSRGVERFEITVNDNSRLQTINSTNNALREVTIVNGSTSNTVGNAYRTTVTNEGDLTVNGTNFVNPWTRAAIDAIAADASLPGANLTPSSTGVNNQATAVAHSGAGAAGFTDVRLIDGSAFKGKLSFTAAISSDAVAKYVNPVDTQASPTADVAGTGNVNFNVRGANFIYTGGNDNDTMMVTIDSSAASSRSVINPGLSDFTFVMNGGEGADAITVAVQGTPLAGNAQHWYNNQKLNGNIAINGGDGADTIRTPGAGDKLIDLGTGDDTAYTDNTGNLGATAVANGASTAAAVAYTNAAAAEYAAALAARVLSNSTGFITGDGVAVGTYITPAAQVAALATLDQITPTNPPALPVITHAALAAGTAAAAAAGAITLAQKVALDAAYNSATGGVVTPAVGIGGPSTLVGHVAVAGAVTAPELAAGDALLATYVAAANTLAAAATAADANTVTHNALLNATQVAAQNAYMAVNGVEDMVTGGAEIGTATIVAGLSALASALVNGTTQAAAVAAIDVATNNGVLTAAGIAPAAVLAAVGAGAMDATDAAAVVALLSPAQNTAAINNATAQATLTAALAADEVAVDTAAGQAAADPVLAAAAVVANDAVGSTEAAAAATAAAAASAAAAADLAASQAINTALTGLKSAVNVGTLDAGVTNAIANANAAIVAAIASSAASGTGAVVANPLTAPVQAALLVLAGVPGAAVDAAEELAFDTGALGVYNANSIDSLIITNTIQTDALAITATNAAAIATITATASTIATAAANSGAASLTVAAPRAVFVFNTTDQTAGYDRINSDDRNLADLKSDANTSNNFYNATLKVSYKGIDSSLTVTGTGYKTTDLEINQAIKNAINTNAVLSKLLLATDGPANSLVVTSLIDGAQVTGNLAVTLTMPTTVTAADVAGAAAAYGLASGSTEAQVLAAMTTAKTTFDAKGDYTTQFAESGAAGGNTTLIGANSLASTDNVITPGTGNDVMVLSTTEDIAATNTISSSNEIVVYAATDLGADTIVNFDISGNGIDQLNFTALNGRGTVALNSLSLDKSIVIGAPTATPLTAAQIAALFTDSATAINHVYVQVDTTNIGSIWTVADAAGTASGNVSATLVGTIDLADTAWGTLTAANFV